MASSINTAINTVNFKVLQPAGSFTAAVAHELIQQFKQDLEAGVRIVLVDLRNVDFMDSFGLGTLASWHSKLKMAGGKLYLCNLQTQVEMLFELSNTDRLFQICGNQDEFYAQVIKHHST